VVFSALDLNMGSGVSWPVGCFAAVGEMMVGMTEITAMVDRLELDLLAARKTGEVVAYLVPHGPCYTEGLAVAGALIERLRDRGLEIKVGTARAENGLALVMEDVTPLAAATG
jgi:hypothetical protein